MLFIESESLSPFSLLFCVAVAMVSPILVVWLNVLLIASRNVLKNIQWMLMLQLCYITCNKGDIDKRNVNEIWSSTGFEAGDLAFGIPPFGLQQG